MLSNFLAYSILLSVIFRLRSPLRPSWRATSNTARVRSSYAFQIVQTSEVMLLLVGEVMAELVDSSPRNLGPPGARARSTAQGERWWSLCSAASLKVDRTHFAFTGLGARELL